MPLDSIGVEVVQDSEADLENRIGWIILLKYLVTQWQWWWWISDGRQTSGWGGFSPAARLSGWGKSALGGNRIRKKQPVPRKCSTEKCFQSILKCIENTHPPVWDQWALSLNRIGFAFLLFQDTISFAWSTSPPETRFYFFRWIQPITIFSESKRQEVLSSGQWTGQGSGSRFPQGSHCSIFDHHS